jgi:hypothetical protein
LHEPYLSGRVFDGEFGEVYQDEQACNQDTTGPTCCHCALLGNTFVDVLYVNGKAEHDDGWQSQYQQFYIFQETTPQCIGRLPSLIELKKSELSFFYGIQQYQN